MEESSQEKDVGGHKMLPAIGLINLIKSKIRSKPISSFDSRK